MMRNILGFALLAAVVLLVLRIGLGILGTLIGVAITVLVLAAMGYALYVVLRLFSPSTAARLRDAMRGAPKII
jgi:thiol:disulfide interchange protein